MFLNFYAAFFKEFRGKSIVKIGENNNTPDPGGNESFRTCRAGHIRHIGRCPFDAVAALGRLNERIHLGMNGAGAVIVNDKAPRVFTVLIAGNGTVVTGRDHVFLFDQNTPAMHARACRTFGGEHREF